MHKGLFRSLLILFLFSCSLSFARIEQRIDSLEKILNKDVPDSTKMDALDLLINLEWKHDLKKALYYAKNFLYLSIKNNNDQDLALASNLMAGSYYFLGDYKNALLYNVKCLQVKQKLRPDGKTVGSKKSIASSHINIAQLYLNFGNYTKAIENNLAALKLKEEIKDSIGIARVLTNLGNVYETLQNYDKAIEFHDRSLEVSRIIGDEYLVGSCYNNLGNVYTKKDQIEKAVRAYEKAIEVRKEIKDEEGLYSTYNNVGGLLLHQKNYKEAKKYYELAWSYYSNSLDPTIRTSILVNLGQLYKHFEDLQKAEEYLKEAVQIAQKNKLVMIEKDAYQSMAQMFSGTKSYDKAYKYLTLYTNIIDTIFQLETSKQIAELQTKYDDAYKTNQLENLKQEAIVSELESSRQELEIQKQTNFRNVSLVGVVLLIFIGFLFYNRYQLKGKLNLQLEEQNRQIAEKNMDITNSITYAKRIQNAIVPSQKSVSKLFPDSFILYKPKDIVAGDFYWCEEAGGKKFIAVADCTGHGVPGAMVSVVCSNALNRVVFEFNISDPGKILDKARELIVETFSKSDEQVNDGMDISLLCLDGKELKWAGANNSLVYVHGGALREIKSHKQPIGKSLINTPYPTNKISYSAGDIFYLFTDGYADQFGGKDGKKLKYKSMLSKFHEYSDLSMDEQKLKLDAFFEEWRGNLEQVDDVCVIGVKV
jgi:serine phosphatase RsbU (regulator of sigma subunit)/Tfp pilus assembly protein PilF